jgi:malonyl-CoA decarboxylase
MVNYVYDLGEIEANHFALTELGTVVTAKPVQALLDDAEPKDGKGKGKKKAKSDRDLAPA